MSEFEPVSLTLKPSPTQSVAIEILPHGLTIHRVLVETDGRTHDIVIGPEEPQGHLSQKYTNTVVGRYANRVPVGTHTLERNGVKSEFSAQSNESPQVSLHGGPVGFDAVPWTLLSSENPPQLFSKAELSRLNKLSETSSSFAVFQLQSPDGDQGCPGSLTAEVCIALIGPDNALKQENVTTTENALGSIVIIYRAKLNGETKTVTPVNLTQHWGFNLEASLQDGPESLLVKNHALTIKADHVAELGSNALATGNFIPVSTVPAHDHSGKLIGSEMPNSGYDDYYLFEDKAKSSIPTRIPSVSFNEQSDFLEDLLRPANDENRGSRPEPLATLSSAKSGLKLEFDSNQHGVMFYSNAMASVTKGARKKIHGGSGITGHGDAYGPGTAVFLEFHNPIAAFLHPANKDGEDTLLTSDEVYHNYVRADIKAHAKA
ncbi:Galactose mutarotase [Psilocybe cubensis]|uniref:Galactose mutarotase-like protein n=2 Tax=Psilocybe cubensis TaxID=181762 RepID=A0A8H7Y274_PSICU|nr:Galactose mutarotase [Psilocybe cubensis]KAH9481106.1 Galactose mutarotase [Psilocybe cubensis]